MTLVLRFSDGGEAILSQFLAAKPNDCNEAASVADFINPWGPRRQLLNLQRVNDFSSF